MTTPAANNDDYAALAELAGGFIHEIKNHLSTFNLNLQLLAEDFQNPETQRERRAVSRVQRLQSECQRLIDLSSAFLQFARIKEVPLEPADLRKLVEEMVDFFTPTARAASIEIKTFLPADLPSLMLNKELFRQALLNLMLNAVQAMPNGGELTVQAAQLPLRPAGGEAAGATSPPRPAGGEGLGVRGGAVVLSLIDTGPGIAPEELPKIFRPFYSTKAKTGGSGLGLPTTKKIVAAHHGSIEVESELGKGTKFTILLPVP